MYLKYIELELKGKLAANFNLVAIASTPKSSTKIMYQTSDSTKPLKIVDGVTIFKDGLSSFTTSSTFDATKNVMAFPDDAKLLITMDMGSVKFEAFMALVVDIDVTGSNTFTAQSGAFANADTRVALYVFDKGECEYKDGYKCEYNGEYKGGYNFFRNLEKDESIINRYTLLFTYKYQNTGNRIFIIPK